MWRGRMCEWWEGRREGRLFKRPLWVKQTLLIIIIIIITMKRREWWDSRTEDTAEIL